MRAGPPKFVKSAYLTSVVPSVTSAVRYPTAPIVA